MELQKEPKTKKLKSNYENLIEQSIGCSYVRFKDQPVPPGINKEPVYEFYVKSTTNKYVVDLILWTPLGVIYKAYGETNTVPLGNVSYCRWIL